MKNHFECPIMHSEKSSENKKFPEIVKFCSNLFECCWYSLKEMFQTDFAFSIKVVCFTVMIFWKIKYWLTRKLGQWSRSKDLLQITPVQKNSNIYLENKHKLQYMYHTDKLLQKKKKYPDTGGNSYRGSNLKGDKKRARCSTKLRTSH